jgi:hypothetical protein
MHDRVKGREGDITQVTNSVVIAASERKHIMHMGEVDQEMHGVNTGRQCDVDDDTATGKASGGCPPGTPRTLKRKRAIARKEARR